jgi:DNA-binding transcriptional MocR family regulator
MAAEQKLSETEVKTIRRRLRAGAKRRELAEAYGVNRKTITRRVQALERAERARERLPASAPEERAESGCADAVLSSRFRFGTYPHWVDERRARPPVSPDPRVRLLNESGETAGSTSASNAERMRAALEPRHGPLRVVPA